MTNTPAKLQRHDVPDVAWPSSNELGIPDLLLEMQGERLAPPFVAWGSIARTTQLEGTWHFYVDDYRFANVWSEPYHLPNTGCAAVVEPNFSTAPHQPAAVAHWGIYRKRWLARWWQQLGIRVFADINVAPQFAKANTIGLPRGWGAFATRAWRYGMTDIDMKVQHAIEACESVNPVVLLYGGGRDAKALADHRGWLWTPEQSDEARGRLTPPPLRRGQ